MQRGAGERPGQRNRAPETGPKAFRAVAHAVALQRDLAALQDQEPGRAPAVHIVPDAEANLARLEGEVRERAGVRRQWPHALAAPDGPHRPDLVLATEGRRLGLRGGRRGVQGCALRIHRASSLRQDAAKSAARGGRAKQDKLA